MSDIYFVSDTHFSHANIIKYSKRPFKDIVEMDEILIENWNKVVKPKDIVYHLGDFSFAKETETNKILLRLNGNKLLLKGNHDKSLIKSSAVAYFGWVKDYYELKHDKQLIVLAHYSHRVWRNSHHQSWHLWGHSHGSLPPLGKSVDVGVDSTWITGKAEYRPFSYDEVKTFMSTRQVEFVDHHQDE